MQPSGQKNKDSLWRSPRPWQTICLIGFYLFSTLGILACFVLPSHIFQDHFPQFIPAAKTVSLVLLVACGLAAASALLLHQALNTLRQKEPLRPKINFQHPYQSHLFFYLNLILAVFLFAKVAFHLSTPLDIDENIHALSIAQGRIAQELNPINTDPAWYTQNHVLPQMLSILSTKIFGLNKIAYRLPALLFTFLILLAIFGIDPELAASPVSSFLLLHLSLNEMTHWYLHSARGYAGMMLLSLIPLLIVWKFTRSGRAGSRSQLWLYGICFLLSVFTHMFGAIFNGLLFLSLLLWLAINGKALTRSARHFGFSLVTISLSLLPVIAFVLMNNMILLQRIGDLATGKVPPLPENLMGAAGLSYFWEGKLLLLFLVAIVIHGFVNGRRFRNDLLSLFLAMSVGFFSLCILVLQIRVFESRFILGFIAPLVFWITESIPYLRSRWAALLALATVTLTIVLLPWLSAPAIQNTLSMNVADYDYFIGMVRKITAPVADHCYYFSGKRDLALWAKDFYFHDALNAKGEEKKCRLSYYIHIDPGMRVDPVTGREILMIDGGPPPHSHEVLKNQSGMSLYEATR